MVYFYTKEISAVSDSGEKAMPFLLSETIFVDIWYVTRILKKSEFSYWCKVNQQFKVYLYVL